MKAWKFQVVQHNQQNITHQQAFIRFVTGTQNPEISELIWL